ncbi:MAG: RagB/SusD family nutrient uptake outer membrane protein [Chitinophagaceae bacterium]|nr:RagB/SusD family nutrient uptake outer membrane protein [Chitinophagaceae bacterium]
MKTIIFTGLLSLVLFSSCHKTLDINPTDRYPDPLVWQDENLLKMFVNQQYNGINTIDNFYEIMYFSDDNFCKYNRGGVNIVRDNILTPDNVSSLTSALNVWDISYSTIHNINLYFQNISASTVDESVKEDLTAEMKFVRAYVYAKLIWSYGSVPIIEDAYEINSDWSQVKRNSWDECVAYIVKDLDEVIASLPSRPAIRNRAGGDAARALKSRVLLYDASLLNNPDNDSDKWQKASDAAEDLFDKGYTLAPDYQKMFIDVNCSEFIFSKEFSETYPSYLTFYLGTAGDGGRAWVTPSVNIVDAYETTDGEIPVTNSELGTVNPASIYNPNDPYANRDPRFYASIYYNGSTFVNRQIETFVGGYDATNQDATITGYYIRKFIEEAQGIVGTKNYTAPFPLFRLSEMYLNYAEAQYHLGNEDKAREYVNKIRSRAGVNMPPITEGGTELLDRIYHERQIELAFEGHRYFDVRRWKIADEIETTHIMGHEITKNPNGTFTYNRIKLTQDSRKNDWTDAFYRLPIPFSEIQKSNNSLVQNAGY